MTAIVCDICKKAVAGARKDVNYVAILDKDICMPCQDELMLVDQAADAPPPPLPVQGLPGRSCEEPGKDEREVGARLRPAGVSPESAQGVRSAGRPRA